MFLKVYVHVLLSYIRVRTTCHYPVTHVAKPHHPDFALANIYIHLLTYLGNNCGDFWVGGVMYKNLIFNENIITIVLHCI